MTEEQTDRMPRWQRVYLASCGWIVGFAATYCAAQWGEWPKLTYFPLARRWELWEIPPSPLPMQYIGLILWGVGGGLVLAATLWLLSAMLKPMSDSIMRLCAAWTISAFAISGLFFTWNLWPF